VHPELIYCAAGNPALAGVAIKYGFTYGARLPATAYFPPEFVDNDYKLPDRAAYMKALEIHRPRIATVLDWEQLGQKDEVFSWAEEASRYVTKAVIIIPKAHGTIDSIPSSFNSIPVRLGYSVPTSYGGTELHVGEFGDRPVHLLGGSPQKQSHLTRYLNVVSADGNYVQKEAVSRNQYFTAGANPLALNKRFTKLEESVYKRVGEDAYYLAFELSCMNIRAMWAGCGCIIRFAIAADVPSVQKIAYQYRDELGRVMRPALLESAERHTLLVAEHENRIVGFCNYRARKDGVSTIYEIAVDRAMKGLNIGRGLFVSVPQPVRLKCTQDNPANGFYLRMGMENVGVDSGRLRPLNIYQTPAPQWDKAINIWEKTHVRQEAFKWREQNRKKTGTDDDAIPPQIALLPKDDHGQLSMF